MYMAVVLVFGASMASPRELIRLDFDEDSQPHGDSMAMDQSGDEEDIDAEDGAARVTRVRLCVRKFISVLIQAASNFSR
jgi:hypothetical protein